MWAFCNSNEGLLFDNSSSSDDLVNITLISNHSLILMIRDLKTIFVSEINFVAKQTLATRILLTRSSWSVVSGGVSYFPNRSGRYLFQICVYISCPRSIHGFLGILKKCWHPWEELFKYFCHVSDFHILRVTVLNNEGVSFKPKFQFTHWLLDVENIITWLKKLPTFRLKWLI